MPTVELPLATLLGSVFVVAAAGKLIRIGRFRDSLESYRLAVARPLLAWLVPIAELTLGAGLVIGVPGAGWAALSLLCAFSIALAVEVAAGSAPASCGCLVPGTGLPAVPALIRNAGLGAVALAAAAGVRPRLGEGFWLASFAGLWVLVAVLAALVFALYRQVGVL